MLAALVMLAGCKGSEGSKCSKQDDCKPGLECDDYRCTDRRRIRECNKRCQDAYRICYSPDSGGRKCHSPKECRAMLDVCADTHHNCEKACKTP